MFTTEHYPYFRPQINLVNSLIHYLSPVLVKIYYSIYALTYQEFSSNITKFSTLRRKKEPDYGASMRAKRNIKVL